MGFSGIDFGVLTYDYAADEVVTFAQTLEACGFGTFWFGEHYVAPRKFSSAHTTGDDADDGAAIARTIIFDEVRLYDPWWVLGTIAGATSKIKVGTAITIVPLNQPLLLARATATAHDLSGGRFQLGTGIGWLKEEYEALGIPYSERGRRLQETLEILKLAWAGGYFAYQGRHFAFDDLQITHRPTPVPLIMGGNTEVALRRAARMGDGWLNSATIPLEDALRMRERLEALRREYGLSAKPFSYHVRPERTADVRLIEQFVAEGFTNIVFWGPAIWPNRSDAAIEEKVQGVRSYAKCLGLV